MTGHMLDAYTLRARVFPALLALSPVLALGAALVDWNDIGMPEAIASLAVNRHPSLTPHRRAMLTPSGRELLRLQARSCGA